MEKESFGAAHDGPQQIQVNLDPNSYMITMVNMVFNEESFHFLLTSGNQGRQFTATPKHAKRIYLLLKQQIENYEKQFGEIKTQLPERPKTTQEENKVGF
ncbi:MAG: hypothetical protein A2402_02315 [Candidatus Staskawiczbacteria bacterium RIFOXYC1_FULL_37_43]|nr:MAG: hypothetical protein A2813_01955 [Candidatus Staskawiczbacteria bacterium RIFCSPHIGHO2_01_FULL_37_17]OGZ71221.1 MAG: hypothetical protein A2891_03080 [Candidatus Staskawiczbacteria bacterium RIFCSPLOWO2_01_FULL_37_19]OGZ75639.1 MAG: hypothetical protein A2205_00395 [Candidatus Staskawiczbacteria bacterium RIFOXYA1_FULL_37_15]OGZ76663.1 MAG: hypothetical protein A2280_00485 [Candidatus Staskawiczbacteria bacterium RIFOXYA12_FULL_37_10]OGZ79915.1 MAG: hypothetical protein A2353_01635 [Can